MKYFSLLAAINVPDLVQYGLVVILPLLFFEVVVEALILEQLWSLPFFQLCQFTLFANGWSQLAGIAVRIVFLVTVIFGIADRVNSSMLVAVAWLMYFLVTLLVEVACAFQWLHRHSLSISKWRIIWGIIVANLTSYAVLVGLNMYLVQALPPVETAPPRFERLVLPEHEKAALIRMGRLGLENKFISINLLRRRTLDLGPAGLGGGRHLGPGGGG